MPSTMLGIRVDDPLDDISQSYVDVPDTSVLLLSGNEFRRLLILQNDGNNDVYLMFGHPAMWKQGICLKPGMNATFSLCTSSICNKSIYAITKSQQTTRVLILEGI